MYIPVCNIDVKPGCDCSVRCLRLYCEANLNGLAANLSTLQVWEALHRPSRDWYLLRYNDWPELAPGLFGFVVQVRCELDLPICDNVCVCVGGVGGCRGGCNDWPELAPGLFV